jgi:hypothetical protein
MGLEICKFNQIFDIVLPTENDRYVGLVASSIQYEPFKEFSVEIIVFSLDLPVQKLYL